MSKLDDWMAQAATALDLPTDLIDTKLRDDLLDLTREAAHNVTRIAGPLTTYLVGIAVGQGMSSDEALKRTLPIAEARANTDDADE